MVAPGILSLGIFVLCIFLLFYLVLKLPYLNLKIGGHDFFIESYALGMIIGPAILLLLNLLTPGEIFSGLKSYGGGSPLGILALFLSMVFLSVFLDIVGFIEFCAKQALRLSGKSGRKLFFLIYLVVSLMTIFTSNDIIILTMTPFIYYFSKHAGINPKPMLFAEFFAANTWSMMLYIGNPTNIFVVSAYDIKFFEYTRAMLLPTIISGIVSMALLYYIFRKEINISIHPKKIDPYECLKDPRGAALGSVFLILCIIGLAISPYFDIEMWSVAIIFAIVFAFVILIRDIRKKTNNLMVTLSRMPWSVIPFLISFFIMANALSKYRITEIVGQTISSIVKGNLVANVFVYGVGSAVAANFLNNIPMTITFTKIISVLSGKSLFYSALAVVIGSNLGANFTPIGALAGIMWMSILKNKECDITFQEFVRYGLIVNIAPLLIALGLLSLMASF